MADAATERDWEEALNSAAKSLRANDLSEWELHLIGRRVKTVLTDMQERKVAITDQMVEAGAIALFERCYLSGPHPTATDAIKAARKKMWEDHPEEDREYYHDEPIHHDGKQSFREMARTVLQAAIT